MQHVNELESIYIITDKPHYFPPTLEILHNKESIFIFWCKRELKLMVVKLYPINFNTAWKRYKKGINHEKALLITTHFKAIMWYLRD